ncbi:hypothetical protein [Caulobacter sp. Root343]|uniref:hypothetical protein n=1 Tax=Caulobacter sp. Root343 TaxID=1736520 RepID=UPI0012E363CD|nr:hypothetical protein [Caulobacter sp. Root343]
MTRDEIDRMLDQMAAESAAKSDVALLPGVISFNSSTWVKMSPTDLPTTCESVKAGVRYRGVQVLISSAFDDGVLNRAEDGGRGQPYRDLEQRN